MRTSGSLSTHFIHSNLVFLQLVRSKIFSFLYMTKQIVGSGPEDNIVQKMEKLCEKWVYRNECKKKRSGLYSRKCLS